MTHIIDLSKPVQYNTDDPWFMKVRVRHKPHHKAYLLIRYFIGLPARLFPKGFIGWADDTITRLPVHATTHIDAPWHYGPEVAGKKAKTADEIPLEWCFGDGIVLNMSHKTDYDPITVKDLEQALEQTGVVIHPGTIVLIRTDRDKYLGTKEYPYRGTGMSREATEWLIDQGVKVMGIDQWGWDLPLKHMAGKARESNNPELFWEGHLAGIQKEYCHLEQLMNLSSLPSHGFKVAVFPLKITGASAAPVRAVAILD